MSIARKLSTRPWPTSPRLYASDSLNTSCRYQRRRWPLRVLFVYCRRIGRDQRDRDVVVVVGSGESRRACGKEALPSATRFAIRARRDAREPQPRRKSDSRAEKSAFRPRRMRSNQARAADAPHFAAVAVGIRRRRRYLRPGREPWRASCGRRPVVGSVSAGERGGSGDLAAAARNLPRARRVSARKVTEISPFATRGRRRDAGRDRHSRRPIPPRSRTHIRAPPLHRRSAVLEPSILPVRALLVRDGLTQIRPHREPLFLSSGRRRNRSGSSSPGASGPSRLRRREAGNRAGTDGSA